MITGMIKGMDEMLLIFLHQLRRVKCHHKRYLLSDYVGASRAMRTGVPIESTMPVNSRPVSGKNEPS
jgi:hypothetical protein